MKLSDLKVSTQLRLGLGLILALVVGLGAVSWRQADQLWKQTRMMYEHPLQVTRALGQVGIAMERASRHLGDVFLARNGREIETALQRIEVGKADTERQVPLLMDRYLGPRRDLTDWHDELVKWNHLREETLRLFREGKASEARDRIGPGGVQDAQAVVVRSRLRKAHEFAENKAGQLYRDAEAARGALKHQLAAIVAAILSLSLVIAGYLLKGIKGPLVELTAVATQFRHGKRDVRSRSLSANEFGILSAAFNTMAEAIQAQMQMNANAAQLADVMLREEEIHAFCRELLKALLHRTGSQVGAVYLLNEAETVFEHFESIGLGAGGHAAFSATELEGELGAALATREIQRTTDIPAESRFAFAAVSGEFQPREILTIPVLSDHHVAAVVSLASVRAYDEPSIQLVNSIQSVLTARLNGVLAFAKVKHLAERLEVQNRELELRKRELDAQADELREQNAELEMQKRQLGEANRLKSAFLSNMSHELRTPLNSVIALAGVLSRRLANTVSAEEHGYLEIIERNGRDLLSQINDILDLSRIEAGREEVRVSRFSLRELAEEIVAMLEPLAGEKQVALLNQVSADLAPIASDPEKCRHILQNLVGNAVKFTEQGQVTIATRQTGDEITIAVTDTGIGIAADQLPGIFDEFRQADSSASRRYGGTGLGLAISRKYARLLRGGLTVESTPGEGSTFTLRLPLALELPDPAQRAETGPPSVEGDAAPARVPSGQDITLLVVEDSEPAVIQLTEILRAEGYRVQVARNGKEALAQIEQTVPDAMILDLMMPEVDGFQVLKTVRGAERTAQLPVLVLTARHVNGEELGLLEGDGIHQLIRKGDINQAGLLAAVARMVAPRPEAPTPRPRRSPARPGKPVVLVVEDNPDSRLAARALLKDRYQVLEAADGRAGVEQARTHLPDLILMDLAMPVMDGVQALREIRKDESLRHIPVIALTASAMEGDRETALAHGFDNYLSKPMDEGLLYKTLREALD